MAEVFGARDNLSVGWDERRSHHQLSGCLITRKLSVLRVSHTEGSANQQFACLDNRQTSACLRRTQRRAHAFPGEHYISCGHHHTSRIRTPSIRGSRASRHPVLERSVCDGKTPKSLRYRAATRPSAHSPCSMHTWATVVSLESAQRSAW